MKTDFSIVNKPERRLDASEKVTGRVKFAADLNLGNQLYAVTVYSQYPHAKILSIDTSAAEALDGVEMVMTARDVPGPNIMFGRYPVLAEEEVKYIGDAVAVVAAESIEIAREAARLVKVEYQEIKETVLSIEEALEEGAPLVHEDEEGNIMENTTYHMRAGDVEKGFAEADVVLEHTYWTHFVDQAYIEPEAMLTFPDPYRIGVEIHGCIQNPYSIQQNVADILDMKIGQVKVIQSTIGGSFGGKDESVMFMAARTAVIALKTGRPVKMVLTREESLLESAKRHPQLMHFKIGAKKDGTITTVEDRIEVQGGAYNNKAMFLNWRCSVHAAGTYRVPNVKTDVYAVYTHTIYGGAYRGFSAPQVLFANESLVDELAYELNISPKEIRLKNCFVPGDELPTGQILEPGKIPAPLKEMIEDVCARADFDRKWKQYPKDNKSDSPIKRGIGMSCTFRGTGLGGEGIDTAGATVTIAKDGSLIIQSGLTEMGQGMRTAHAQVVAEVMGISLDRIVFLNTDTTAEMDGGPTVASRGLLAGGKAMMLAAEKLKKRMHGVAAKALGCTREELESRDDLVFKKSEPSASISFDELIRKCIFEEGLSLSAQGWHNPGPESIDHKTGHGNCYPSYIYGVCTTEVTVDTETGKVNVEKIIAAYEVGRAVNPQIVESQMYGGLMQGMGFCIFEELKEENGYLKTLNYDDYMIPSIGDIPEMEIILYESDENVGPFGAKGVGEIGVELPAPAIANAVYHATGRRLRELPLNLERVLLGKAL